MPLHHQLADLGVEFLHLAIAERVRRLGLAGEDPGHALHRLLLPGCDHRRMHAVLGAQLRHCPLSAQRFQRHLGLELSRIALPLACHQVRPSSRSNPP